MIYDLIIIGAGAAGLFAGASLPFPVNGLILEKKASPGKKLLMTGSGQCNLTHSGSIKNFIDHYGKNGPLIRSVLYQFNNLSVIDFFETNGVPTFVREDEKIFPKSLKAQDILDVLTKRCKSNGLHFIYSSPVDRISLSGSDSGIYSIQCGKKSYETRKLIIATGGCSYPSSGSDGSFFNVLKVLGYEIVPSAPALVPIFAEEYPYHNLAGISFPDAAVSTGTINVRDALLLTHNCFSGPAILTLSRDTRPGDLINVNYCPDKAEEATYRALYRCMTGNSKQLLTVLQEYFKESSGELPKRFLETICMRAGADASEKASRITPMRLKSILRLIFRDEYRVKNIGGYESAMVTAGGIALSEISTKTMESKRHPNLWFAGEVLDIDGDTGGYNLQFAFSSGYLAARSLTGNQS